jgi:hypothetical protein
MEKNVTTISKKLIFWSSFLCLKIHLKTPRMDFEVTIFGTPECVFILPEIMQGPRGSSSLYILWNN